MLDSTRFCRPQFLQNQANFRNCASQVELSPLRTLHELDLRAKNTVSEGKDFGAPSALVEVDIFLLRHSEAELACFETFHEVPQTHSFHLGLRLERQGSNMWKQFNFRVS